MFNGEWITEKFFYADHSYRLFSIDKNYRDLEENKDYNIYISKKNNEVKFYITNLYIRTKKGVEKTYPTANILLKKLESDLSVSSFQEQAELLLKDYLKDLL